MQIIACVKWTDLRPVVDPLHGAVEARTHGEGFSESDRAALEVALRVADHWSAGVVLLALGPADADGALRELAASGVARVVRVDSRIDLPSHQVAAMLAAAVRQVAASDEVLVVCGDASADRGSGSVPAFLAAELDAAQALGLIQVTADDPVSEGVTALRRLDGGRRERLSVPAHAVLSVEGGAGELRRASLAATLAARTLEIEVVTPSGPRTPETVTLSPWRPRARVIAAPSAERALDRIVALTGALVDRTPPRTVELDPVAAADEILSQLRTWGYLDGDTDAGADTVPSPSPPST